MNEEAKDVRAQVESKVEKAVLRLLRTLGAKSLPPYEREAAIQQMRYALDALEHVDKAEKYGKQG